jgi:hypothetical protein
MEPSSSCDADAQAVGDGASARELRQVPYRVTALARQRARPEPCRSPAPRALPDDIEELKRRLIAAEAGLLAKTGVLVAIWGAMRVIG